MMIPGTSGIQNQVLIDSDSKDTKISGSVQKEAINVENRIPGHSQEFEGQSIRQRKTRKRHHSDSDMQPDKEKVTEPLRKRSRSYDGAVQTTKAVDNSDRKAVSRLCSPKRLNTPMSCESSNKTTYR